MEHGDEGPVGDPDLEAADLSRVVTGLKQLSSVEMLEGWCQRAFPQSNRDATSRLANELATRGLVSLPHVKQELARAQALLGNFASGMSPADRLARYLKSRRETAGTR